MPARVVVGSVSRNDRGAVRRPRLAEEVSDDSVVTAAWSCIMLSSCASNISRTLIQGRTAVRMSRRRAPDLAAKPPPRRPRNVVGATTRARVPRDPRCAEDRREAQQEFLAPRQNFAAWPTTARHPKMHAKKKSMSVRHSYVASSHCHARRRGTLESRVPS